VAITEHETNQTEPRAQASGQIGRLHPSKRKNPHAIKQEIHPAINNRRVAVPPPANAGIPDNNRRNAPTAATRPVPWPDHRLTDQSQKTAKT
jgi:hypothetical protein